MQRILSCAFLAVFLSLQALTALHAAEYGATEHKHHGKLCEIYLYGEQQKAAGSAVAVITLSSSAITLSPPPLVQAVLPLNRYSDASPRAPPVFLPA